MLLYKIKKMLKYEILYVISYIVYGLRLWYAMFFFVGYLSSTYFRYPGLVDSLCNLSKYYIL